MGKVVEIHTCYVCGKTYRPVSVGRCIVTDSMESFGSGPSDCPDCGAHCLTPRLPSPDDLELILKAFLRAKGKDAIAKEIARGALTESMLPEWQSLIAEAHRGKLASLDKNPTWAVRSNHLGYEEDFFNIDRFGLLLADTIKASRALIREDHGTCLRKKSEKA